METTTKQNSKDPTPELIYQLMLKLAKLESKNARTGEYSSKQMVANIIRVVEKAIDDQE